MRAAAAARRSQKRSRIRVAQARDARIAAEITVDSARRYSARFTPSVNPGTVTYTAPGETPREIPVAPEIELRIDYLESALTSQAHAIAMDTTAIASLQAAVDSTEFARSAAATLAHEEHKAARRAWWRGLGAGVKTAVVAAVVVVGAVVVARR